MITDIEDLSLPPKLESALTNPLEKTVTFLSDNNPNNDSGSCGQLNAFKKELGKAKNDIDSDTREQLIAAAEALQASLNCTN